MARFECFRVLKYFGLAWLNWTVLKINEKKKVNVSPFQAIKRFTRHDSDHQRQRTAYRNRLSSVSVWPDLYGTPYIDKPRRTLLFIVHVWIQRSDEQCVYGLSLCLDLVRQWNKSVFGLLDISYYYSNNNMILVIILLLQIIFICFETCKYTYIEQTNTKITNKTDSWPLSHSLSVQT